MKTCDTFTAEVYVGLSETKPSEGGFSFPTIHTLSEAQSIVYQYCQNNKICVTVTPTQFIHSDGMEAGIMVKLIRYPKPGRIQYTNDEIRSHAKQIATLLINKLGQKGATVVFLDKTTYISAEDAK